MVALVACCWMDVDARLVFADDIWGRTLTAVHMPRTLTTVGSDVAELRTAADNALSASWGTVDVLA